jgi:hypothetical protein
VQTKIRHGGGFKVIVHRHYAAFVFKAVASLQTAQIFSPGRMYFCACCLLLPSGFG